MITFQRGEETHAADAELDVERLEVLRLDDPHGKPGRAARDVGLLDDGDFRRPEFGQVQRRGEADGPPSDDADRRPDHLDYAPGPTQKPIVRNASRRAATSRPIGSGGSPFSARRAMNRAMRIISAGPMPQRVTSWVPNRRPLKSPSSSGTGRGMPVARMFAGSRRRETLLPPPNGRASTAMWCEHV